MGSSDLDVHTLGSGGASGNQLSCSLPSGAICPNVEPAWLAPHFRVKVQAVEGSGMDSASET